MDFSTFGGNFSWGPIVPMVGVYGYSFVKFVGDSFWLFWTAIFLQMRCTNFKSTRHLPGFQWNLPNKITKIATKEPLPPGSFAKVFPLILFQTIPLLEDPFWKMCLADPSFEDCHTYLDFKHAALHVSEKYRRPSTPVNGFQVYIHPCVLSLCIVNNNDCMISKICK